MRKTRQKNIRRFQFACSSPCERCADAGMAIMRLYHDSDGTARM